MNTDHLEYFFAIAQGMNFLQTSEHFHISQSALSRSIQNLEAELNIELLDRSRRSACLTPAGEVLYADCKRILPEMRAIRTHLKPYTLSNEIICGVFPHSPSLRLRVVLDAFAKEHPDFSNTLEILSNLEAALEAVE